MRFSLLSMTIGYLRVGVILPTNRIPKPRIKYSSLPIELNPGQTVEFYCVNQVCKSRSARAKEMKLQSDTCAACWK